ncbi:hypothetical protein EV05_1953 [Prochlorococcus sp. MIT 0601]|nr:hypothetical protein EV05_1953 [Prochlorococcus sp. MIT 0601]
MLEEEDMSRSSITLSFWAALIWPCKGVYPKLHRDYLQDTFHFDS